MRKSFALPAFLALSAMGTAASAADAGTCANPASQQALAACVGRELRETDARLNVVYKAVIAKGDAPTRDALRASQRDWIRDRDAECHVQGGTTDRERWYAGVSANPRIAACVVAETRYRIAVLEAADNGMPAPSRRDFPAQASAAVEMASTSPDAQGKPRLPTRHVDGKWYFEVTIDRQMVARQSPMDIMGGFATDEQFIGNVYRMRASDHGLIILGYAIDLDNGMVYFREAGSWNGKEPGSNLGMAAQLGREYMAQVRGGDRIDVLLANGAIRPNFGDTPFTYPVPDGYRSWR